MAEFVDGHCGVEAIVGVFPDDPGVDGVAFPQAFFDVGVFDLGDGVDGSCDGRFRLFGEVGDVPGRSCCGCRGG